MKTSFGSLLRVVAFALPLLAGSVFAAQPAAEKTPDLLVKVNLPRNWGPHAVPSDFDAALFMDQRLINSTHSDTQLRSAFVDRLAAVFQEKGYKGKIGLIDDYLKTGQGRPILVIELNRWRVDNRDRFDCHFTARLVTPSSEVDLGSITYIDAKIERNLVGTRDVGVQDATDHALADFHRDLAKNDRLALLPAGE